MLTITPAGMKAIEGRGGNLQLGDRSQPSCKQRNCALIRELSVPERQNR
jgi:hypothetical protein